MRSSPTTRREFLTLPRGGEIVPDVAEQPAGSASEVPTESAAAQILNRFTVRAMACQFDLMFDGRVYPQAAEAAWRAAERIEQLEAILSTYREESPVSQVNRRAAVVSVEVPPEVIDLLDMSAALFRDTAGAFDVTSGPLSKAWGFYYRQPRVPTPEAIDAARQLVGFPHVRWTKSPPSISLAKSGVELNFASIGKGYAVDAAAAILGQAGVEEFVIQGGQSSVLARRKSADAPGWTIGVLHPLHAGLRLGTVELRNQALATSGSQRQALIHRGQRLGHILDPRTGWPADQVLSATVVCNTAAEADALATACCLLTPAQLETLCQQRPNVGALVIRTDPSSSQRLIVDLLNEQQMRWVPMATA